MDEDVVKYTVMYMVKTASDNNEYDLEYELNKFRNSDFFKKLNVSVKLLEELKEYYIKKGE